MLGAPRRSLLRAGEGIAGDGEGETVPEFKRGIGGAHQETEAGLVAVRIGREFFHRHLQRGFVGEPVGGGGRSQMMGDAIGAPGVGDFERDG